MKKKPSGQPSIQNRRARYDYDIKDVFTAGIALSGAEVKSLRMSHGHLRGAYVQIKGGEAWLVNGTITPLKTNATHLDETVQTRDRKLLLKGRELEQLQEAKNQGLTIVPLRILNRTRYIKVEIATARGKRKYDKRELIKQRDLDRDAAR
jgi:SsrA-binding protein